MPCLSRSHDDRRLYYFHSFLKQVHQCFRLRIIFRIILREHSQHCAVHHPESRSRIRDLFPCQQSDEPGEISDTASSGEGRLIALFFYESRAYHHIRLLGNKQIIHHIDKRRVMLSVTVYLHGNAILVLSRVSVACLHRAADPSVHREVYDCRSGALALIRGPVMRAVIYYYHIKTFCA